MGGWDALRRKLGTTTRWAPLSLDPCGQLAVVPAADVRINGRVPAQVKRSGQADWPCLSSSLAASGRPDHISGLPHVREKRPD